MAVNWVEIVLTVPEVDDLALDGVNQACLQLSPDGYATEGSDAPPGDDPPTSEGWLRYRIYVGEAELGGAVALLEGVTSQWSDATLVTRPLSPGWRDRWKEYFSPIDVSPRLLVVAPWHTPAPRPEQRVLTVEPGMAFGTGQHETTRLCLEELDARCVEGSVPSALLDVGCGTGILAVAASFFGVKRVVGVDIDPQAVRAAEENIELNDLVGRDLTFSTTDISDVEGRFPLVIANIMAHILTAMAEPLAARVAPGGELWLSGVLDDQAADVTAAFGAQGLSFHQGAQRGRWMRLEYRRP